MRRRIKTMLSVWAGLIAAATMGATGATATTATAAQETFLVLGVQGRDSDRFVTLHCDPASGTHPNPESASGDYQGGQVMFRHTYPNRCDLARHTAPVFEL